MESATQTFSSLKPLLIFVVSTVLLFNINLVIAHGNFQSYNLQERDIDYLEEPILTRQERSEPKFQKILDYEPNWESLDARPLPSWYDEAKIGIFVHWGIYSVPAVSRKSRPVIMYSELRADLKKFHFDLRAINNYVFYWVLNKIILCQGPSGSGTFGSVRQLNVCNHSLIISFYAGGNNNECEQYVVNNYKPNFTYQEFAPDFTAEFFNPYQWADLFSRSGAKYVVLTSKHHEGYTLWPSAYSWNWNSKDVGPHIDLVGELANAIRANTSIKFGLYHSLYEWYNPLWMRDYENNHTTTDFVDFKIWPSLMELVNKYQPEIMWSDGEWNAASEYWRSQEFLAWLYNSSPVASSVVTNDRWGGDTLCRHGGYYTCADRYNPGVLQPHKWENCLTLDNSWGYRKNAKIEDFMTPEKLITTIVESVSCGGNVLVNVGPSKEGIISPVQQERLLQMGYWLEKNGEAIYNSLPWIYQNDTVTPGVWYTTNSDISKVYVMVTSWPGERIHLGAVRIPLPGNNVTITMLGSDPGNRLGWTNNDPGIIVNFPRPDENTSRWVWTLVITGLD